MKRRHLAACLAALSLFGTAATLLRADPPRADRTTLRAEVVRLRTEVEMLRLDYEIARGDLLEDLKLRHSLKTAGGLISFGSALQSALNQAGEEPAPRPETDQDRKQAAAAAEREEKKDAAEEASFIAGRKKELARLFSLLAAKQLDLEDAERLYRASHP